MLYRRRKLLTHRCDPVIVLYLEEQTVALVDGRAGLVVDCQRRWTIVRNFSIEKGFPSIPMRSDE